MAASCPFGGTFLTFSDYSRNALRMAALMKAPSIFVFTHDSIGLGEDGPTHQSIEHVASLRLIPNLQVWRPADTVETAVAWTHAIEHKARRCLIFSASEPAVLAAQRRADREHREGRLRAARLERRHPARKIILIATGSEVELALKAVEPLAQRRHRRTRRVDAVDQRVRPAGRRNTANACCRRACAASRSKRA